MSGYHRAKKESISTSVRKDVKDKLIVLWKEEAKKEIEHGKSVPFSSVVERVIIKGLAAINSGF